MLAMHTREKLPKLKLTPDIEDSANRILGDYLHGDENIPEITDKVYAMGKGIAIKSGIVQRQGNYRRKKSPQMKIGERKLKVEMKKLRKQIARTSSKIYRRIQRDSQLEKELLNEFKKLMGGVDSTIRMLKEYKKICIDKFR